MPELRDPTGARVALRTRKQLAALVFLALEARARPVSRDRLVELFWPEAGKAKARHSLSQTLTALRSALGQDVVRKVGDSLQFVANLQTDLDRPDWDGADIARPL